ncbi:MAG: FeoA family protein [bacterium]|nr:FeoA family protein [bacterium]
MMPLSMLEPGVIKNIVKVGGRDKTRSFLESLGFVEGAEVTVVSELAGNLIINVKDTRVAIDKLMAGRIFV